VDLDFDNDMDILATNCENDPSNMGWLENDGEENFTVHLVRPDWENANKVFPADLDADGDLDLIATASYAGDLSWFENDGEMNFTEHLINDSWGRPSCARAVDMDNDGDLDILASSCIVSQIAWFENNGSQGFTRHIIAYGFNRPHIVIPIDLDADGDYDIVASAIGSDMVLWLENDDLDFIDNPISTTFDGATGLDVKDLDGDGDLDVVSSAQYGNEIRWWQNGMITGIDTPEQQLPEQTSLIGSYPNPFNNSTTIKYYLSTNSDVNLNIYDIAGRRVTSITKMNVPAGYNQIRWNAGDISSGIYFCSLQAGEFKAVKKVTLVK
jgi:hypothetical protein